MNSFTFADTTSCVRSNIDPQVEITYTSAPKKRVLADYFVPTVLKQIFLTLEVGRVARQGELGLPMVDSLSREYGVLKSSMFFGAPEDMHNFSLEQLGDVRIIF